MADGRESKGDGSEGNAALDRRQSKAPSARSGVRKRTSATYERPQLDLPPERPVVVGFVLPDDLQVPDLVGITTERITSPQEVPAESRPRNALVVHASAPHALVDGVLANAVRSPREDDPGSTLQPVLVLGDVHPLLGGLVQRNHYVVRPAVTSTGELLDAARQAADFAVLHAARDPASQLAWARGTLGEWVADAYPKLGPQARVVLALAALGIHVPQQIGAMMGLQTDTIYHHVNTIKGATGATSLEHAAGRFQRLIPLPDCRYGIAIVPLRDTLRRTPEGGVPIPKPD